MACFKQKTSFFDKREVHLRSNLAFKKVDLDQIHFIKFKFDQTRQSYLVLVIRNFEIRMNSSELKKLCFIITCTWWVIMIIYFLKLKVWSPKNFDPSWKISWEVSFSDIITTKRFQTNTGRWWRFGPCSLWINILIK